ncbi:MAG: HU family DNA-binding protein [Oligoflexales bacterium]
MVKSELIERVAERAGITLFKAEELIDLFFGSVTNALCQGGRVEIRGFGAFSVKEYKSYVGRNPKTGEEVQVTPKRLPVWRTGTELRQRVDSAFADSEGGS